VRPRRYPRAERRAPQVEAVEARPLADLAAALRAQSPEGRPQVDGPFVPRPAHYLALLLPALEAKFP